jgi:hypothetical protein
MWAVTVAALQHEYPQTGYFIIRGRLLSSVRSLKLKVKYTQYRQQHLTTQSNFLCAVTFLDYAARKQTDAYGFIYLYLLRPTLLQLLVLYPTCAICSHLFSSVISCIKSTKWIRTISAHVRYLCEKWFCYKSKEKYSDTFQDVMSSTHRETIYVKCK